MDRRQFLIRAGGIASFSAAGDIVRAQTSNQGPALVEAVLEARETWATLAGRPAQLYTYNGQTPGPIIEARAGDTIRISFRNALSETTNLHFHGLHVSPAGNADNSFLEVPSGESITYELPIPKAHPSGMFWYHPHMHGSVARQVSRGMAGLILIRGEFDDQPEVRDTPEYFMVLQDFDISEAGLVNEPTTAEKARGREGPLVTVNGKVNPTVPLVSNGWTRLRLLNASSSRFYRLRLEGHRFTITGVDGGLVTTPFETEELLLVPGQRVDAFVRGEVPSGVFRLLNLPYDRFGAMGGGMNSFIVGRLAMEPLAVASFEYTASAQTQWSMPDRLAPIEILSAPQVRRTFRFGMGMGMGMSAGGFTINGRSFDPNRVDTRVVLGSVEDWDLINASAMDHPFHIHTNAFQIVSGADEAQSTWRDVVLVPAGRSVRIRLQFSDYIGRAMYHCHILDHEDLGMMGIVDVVSV